MPNEFLSVDPYLTLNPTQNKSHESSEIVGEVPQLVDNTEDKIKINLDSDGDFDIIPSLETPIKLKRSCDMGNTVMFEELHDALTVTLGVTGADFFTRESLSEEVIQQFDVAGYIKSNKTEIRERLIAKVIEDLETSIDLDEVVDLIYEQLFA